MIFFPGLHQPSDAQRFGQAFVSVNRLRGRRSDFAVRDWIMDSGASTEIATHGHYRASVADYAAQIECWRTCGNLLCAVAQHNRVCLPFEADQLLGVVINKAFVLAAAAKDGGPNHLQSHKTLMHAPRPMYPNRCHATFTPRTGKAPGSRRC